MGCRVAIYLEDAMGALTRVIDRVLGGSDPLRRQDLQQAIERAVDREAPIHPGRVVRQAADSLLDMGPLDELLEDPLVTDVLVNAHDEIWIERDGILVRTDVKFPTPEAVVAAVERALLPLGLRLDRTSPAVDARLPDGSRLHAVVPPAAVDGPVVAIRRFTAAVMSLDDLIAAESVDTEGARLIEQLVVERTNLIVSGATGSGKTTLLNLLSRLIPPGDRIVTIEEAAELRLDGHVVRLEARPPNAEGVGEITVRNLVRQALRMRPDRIIVGEVRGPEAFDLIQTKESPCGLCERRCVCPTPHWGDALFGRGAVRFTRIPLRGDRCWKGGRSRPLAWAGSWWGRSSSTLRSGSRSAASLPVPSVGMLSGSRRSAQWRARP